MQRLAEANDFPAVDETKRGRYQRINTRDAYIDHLLGYINPANLKPMKLVLNSGNGAAGPVVDAIEARFKALGVPVEVHQNSQHAGWQLPQRYSQSSAAGMPGRYAPCSD